MNIPVIQEDGTENEFEVELCCLDCARRDLGWSLEQYSFVLEKANNNKSINIPNNIDSILKFRNYVKTL